MPGRRIGSIFSQSAYSDGIYVIGANGPSSEPWEDIFYRYFILKLNSHLDKDEVYTTKNLEYNQGFGGHHVHVYLVRSSGKKAHLTQNDYVDTLGFELYSSELSSLGLRLDSLDFLVSEMRRIFMRYMTYSIAGIRTIDSIQVNSIEPPETERNPFQNVYKRLVTIDIYYSEQFLFPITEAWETTHHGSRYYAGQFREEVEDPLI